MTTDLPRGVRETVVRLAAETLGGLSEEAVPASLKKVARFVPARRARAGATALATALERDATFRQRVADHATQADPDLADAVRAGSSDAAVPEQAAFAYLLRSDGWQEQVAAAAALQVHADRATAADRSSAEVERLREQLVAARVRQSELTAEHANELATATDQLEQLRRQVRSQGSAVRAAEKRAETAEERVATAERVAAEAVTAADREIEQLRRRAADADIAVEAARQAAREGRSVDEARLWLLVETITGAAQGLRRELALRPTDVRPADAVRGAGADTATPAGVDSPERLDRLLALPRAHLVIDGYNVTKTGYGELSLADQRHRLVSRLAGLAAQTRAEVTVVFDGAQRPPSAPPTPRGVRVLFSEPGEIADEVIRRLVRAEPSGRVVVVVSTDREVADGVRRSGAYAVTSATFLRMVERS